MLGGEVYRLIIPSLTGSVEDTPELEKRLRLRWTGVSHNQQAGVSVKSYTASVRQRRFWMNIDSKSAQRSNYVRSEITIRCLAVYDCAQLHLGARARIR